MSRPAMVRLGVLQAVAASLASQLVANVRESVAVNKAGRYLERAGKLGSALASIRAIEEGSQP